MHRAGICSRSPWRTSPSFSPSASLRECVSRWRCEPAGFWLPRAPAKADGAHRSRSFAMPKVLISDKLSPAAVAIFKDRGIETDVKTDLDKAGIKAVIGDYDGLAIRSNTKVTADLLSAARNLKVIGRAGI